ncbi:MAG: putative glycoside hydrolase [Rikenellaceae bacterium]
MKNILLGFLAFCLVGCVTATSAPVGIDQSGFPEFSWDSLPVALHFSKDTDFTEDELQFMSRFPLVCFEKHQGIRDHGNVRDGAYAASKALKELNPKAKVLFYWNARIDNGRSYFGHNMLDNKHKVEWAQRDTLGKFILTRGTQRNYEPAIPEFRDWWVSVPAEALETGVMDGVFIDAIQQHINKPGKRLGEKNMAASLAGVEDMLTKLSATVGKERILIFNNFNPGNDLETGYSKYANGGMIEHYCYRDTDTPDFNVKQIETVQRAAREGRVMMVKCWPRYYFRKPGPMKGKTQEQIVADVREDIVFPLACYLVAAGKYSYFLYSWGWRDFHGIFVDYPEYHKPLGEPYGEAKKDGYIFTRSFKYADVWVDVENRKAKIDWKDKE